MRIVATYYMIAGGMSMRLPGDRVTMFTGTQEQVDRRLSDIRDSMKVLPVKITVEP